MLRSYCVNEQRCADIIIVCPNSLSLGSIPPGTAGERRADIDEFGCRVI
jgi:hypothetical protein